MNTQTMISLTIDGKPVSVPKGSTVYHAAKQLGIDLPIFCYQDRMPPFGACRVCLVEVEKMAKLQTSCTLEATEGMVVKTQSQIAEEGRKSILEFLLINHPLDCPICDRGGECPLQDNTIKFGPGKSRFYEEKRRFKKPIPLGPVLMLDRERCISCARCTRFGEIVAGDYALQFIDRGFKTEVGTPDEGPARSKYIGNTIMICPVGALTSDVYRFRSRPWDNQATQSTCTLCPVGCSLILDSRDGKIMRTRSHENQAVNDIWLCDKGWFGYEFSDQPDRLQKPLIKRNGSLEPATWDEALSLIAAKIREAKPNGKLAAFGGNPLTTEENFLLQKLMREGAGTNHIDHRIGMPILPNGEEGLAPGMEISIGECEELSYVILLGVDLTEEFPVIWLRLKQAINRGAKIIYFGHFAPEIASHLSEVILHAPGEEIEMLHKHQSALEQITKESNKGAIFVGGQYLNHPKRTEIINALENFRQPIAGLSLNLLEGKNNSMGARFAGMRPDVGPQNTAIDFPGMNAVQVVDSAIEDGWDFLLIAGADPANKFDLQKWQKARSKIGFLVVQDLFMTKTAQQADVVLPTLSFVEKEGSFINIEGRVQKLRPGKDIPNGIYSDGEIFSLIALKLNFILNLDKDFADKLQSNERLPRLKSDVSKSNSTVQNMDVNKDFLAMTFAGALFDHGIRMQHNKHLVELCKEPCIRINPKEGIKRGLNTGETVNLKANGCIVSGKICLDYNVAEGTAVLPLGFPEIPVHQLSPYLMNGLKVEVVKQ